MHVCHPRLNFNSAWLDLTDQCKKIPFVAFMGEWMNLAAPLLRCGIQKLPARTVKFSFGGTEIKAEVSCRNIYLRLLFISHLMGQKIAGLWCVIFLINCLWLYVDVYILIGRHVSQQRPTRQPWTALQNVDVDRWCRSNDPHNCIDWLSSIQVSMLQLC